MEPIPSNRHAVDRVTQDFVKNLDQDSGSTYECEEKNIRERYWLEMPVCQLQSTKCEFVLMICGVKGCKDWFSTAHSRRYMRVAGIIPNAPHAPSSLGNEKVSWQLMPSRSLLYVAGGALHTSQKKSRVRNPQCSQELILRIQIFNKGTRSRRDKKSQGTISLPIYRITGIAPKVTEFLHMVNVTRGSYTCPIPVVYRVSERR